MKRGIFYRKLPRKAVQCTLCPRNCVILEGGRGYCLTRINFKGELYSLAYGNPTGLQIDPIEKKPFYHFNPGSRVLSFGTQGCNFRCEYCCNYYYSMAFPEKEEISVRPEDIVERAIKEGCEGIAYTYNEPTTFFEYALDTMKLAHSRGLFNVFVTNGSINREPLMSADDFLDAVVIDFKGFNESFYEKFVHAKLSWVKEGVRNYKALRAHKEVTYLVVPTLTDSEDEVRKFSRFIIKELGPDTPVHFIRFFPMYKMLDYPETPLSILENCHDLAKEEGLNYVYAGNADTPYTNTYCPDCGALLIRRAGNRLIKSNMDNGRCPKCGKRIPVKGSVRVNHLPYFG